MSLVLSKIESHTPFSKRFVTSKPSPISYIPSSYILKMGGEKDWTNKISEVYRIDRRLLSKLPNHVFSEIKEWENKINLKYTAHAIKRMKEYVGKLSERPWDDGKHYIEFYNKEEKYLVNSKNLQNHFHQSKMVEIGLNRFGKVCKVSYILPLHEFVPLLYGDIQQSRYLFFCVCVDGYIKTINITPNEKKRGHYGGLVEYLNEYSFLSVIHGYS